MPLRYANRKLYFFAYVMIRKRNITCYCQKSTSTGQLIVSGDIFINIEDAHCIETSTNYTNLKNEDLTYILTELRDDSFIIRLGTGYICAGGSGRGGGEK